MANEKVKFEAPAGRILIQAYREEANWYDREEKPNKAAKMRRLADRMEALIRQQTAKKEVK